MRWLLALLVIMAMVPAAQAQAPRDKLNQTQKQLQLSAKKEKELQAQLMRSKREVDALRYEATKLAEDLQAAERRVSTSERDYAGVNAKLQAKEKDYEARKAEYMSTLGSMMRMQRMPATALIAEPDNVHQVLRTARVMQHVNGALAARAAQLRSDMEKLQKLRDANATSKAKLSKETIALEAKQRQLARDISRRQALQKKLSKDVASEQKKVAELSRQSASLQDLIGKLERNQMVIASRGKKPTPIPASPARGRWKTPVTGGLAYKYGQHKSANETYRGLGFAPRGGATVVAPAAGEVVFTGPFRDYGRMVLIKHGNNRISLLAGMGNIQVTLNQSVSAGEPVGTMGNGSGQRLYYELREGGKPVDPSGWFANLGPTLAKQ